MNKRRFFILSLFLVTWYLKFMQILTHYYYYTIYRNLIKITFKKITLTHFILLFLYKVSLYFTSFVSLRLLQLLHEPYNQIML